MFTDIEGPEDCIRRAKGAIEAKVLSMDSDLQPCSRLCKLL